MKKKDYVTYICVYIWQYTNIYKYICSSVSICLSLLSSLLCFFFLEIVIWILFSLFLYFFSVRCCITFVFDSCKEPPSPPFKNKKKRIVFRYCHPLIITKESKLYMYRTKWYIILNGWSRPCSPFCFKVHHAFYRVIIIELYKVDNGQVLSLYYVDC